MRVLNKIRSLFQSIPHIGITNRNYLMISADIKKGRVIVSYKKKVVHGSFSDNTLRNMMKGVRFEKNAEEFLIATAKLINQVIQ
jgi:hypothetical protein